MSSHTVFIESKHDKTLLQLYASSLTKNDTDTKAPAMIIAHPYGPLGGNMNNNVVMAIQNHFYSKGFVTVCMNFRGCGKSKGKTSWTGMPEREDYISVVDYLIDSEQYKALNFPKISHLILCGYSFGAMIASSIPCEKVPCAYLLISLPLGVYWALATTKASYFKQCLSETSQVLSIHGDGDQFTGTNRYSNWCKDKKNIYDVCISAADHFWVNMEHELVKQVEIWQNSLNFSR